MEEKEDESRKIRKRDPNRILYTLPYVIVILPISILIMWVFLEAIGFIKRG